MRRRDALQVEIGGVLLKEQLGEPGHHRCARASGRPHLCFLLEGSFTERRGSDAIARTAGEVRVSPAGDVHEVEFGETGGRCLMISAPERLQPADGPRFARSRALDDLCRAVRREMGDPDASTPLIVEAAAYECFDLLWTDGRGSASPGRWLQRVRELLHDRADEIPSLDEVARVADRHPTHVARTFRETYGCTVGHYARQIRLRRTVELIRDGRRTLSEVAYTMGFTDQSHMTRAVRSALGRTPGELRRLADG